MRFVEQIRGLRKIIGNEVDKRLKEFSAADRFSELCFCILTANSKASTAMAIQNELGSEGFLALSEKRLAAVIKKNKHRFHNNKARYIVEARKHKDIKCEREWLVNNVKGLGYKEASHLLRNIGFSDYAILDRHILNLMVEHRLIEKPKTLTKKKYLEIEKKFLSLARQLKMTAAELDLYMWYMKTGKVLK